MIGIRIRHAFLLGRDLLDYSWRHGQVGPVVLIAILIIVGMFVSGMVLISPYIYTLF